MTNKMSIRFDPREVTIASVHKALYEGSTDCRTIVSSYISRIEALNHHTNAIITLAPDALSVADELDKMLASKTAATGPLFGIPVLLKDNFDTADMPTTGSCLALAHSQPTVDAPVVTALKKAGAIIIGKTNLHEMALEGLSVSSLGGQTINPYDSTRTPGGSSGGTGAAVAASFAVFGTGTDTMNSLRSPASANGLFSCRPTRGLISRNGIIPNSDTQDAAGPIARCVEDVAIALTVMASVGYDEQDKSTALVPANVSNTDYATGLTTGSLEGVRLGVLEGFSNRTASDETTPVNDGMEEMLARLTAAGATIVPITEDMYDAPAIQADHDVQRYEFQEGMDAYLQRPSLGGQHPSTLKELYSSDGHFLVIPTQYERINNSLVSSTSDSDYATRQNRIQNLRRDVEQTFTGNNLDTLIYPHQKNLVVKLGSPTQAGRNGILAAVTGFPSIAVPAGFCPASAEAPVGVPIGMEILGLPWTEAKLLQIAYQVQQLNEVRRTPVWAEEEVPVKRYETVPVVKPDGSNIPDVYPLGQL